MKTVFITGSSSGIGYTAALIFARRGYQVVATMRNIEKQSTLQNVAKQEGLKIDIRQLDVIDEHSVQSVVESVLADYGQIDILINNAGAGYLGSLEQMTLAEAQSVMDVNFFGTWRLTKAVLPSMRKKKSGRIVSVTSVGGVIGQPFNEAYCAAKFAIEGMMESLAPVLRRFGVDVAIVEPGPVNSEFVSTVRQSSPKLSAELENDYKAMIDTCTQSTQDVFAKYGQKPEEVAEIIFKVATDVKPQFRYQTSAFSKQIVELKFVDTTGDKTIEFTGKRLG